MSNQMDGARPGPTQEQLQQEVDANMGGAALGVPPAEAAKLLRQVLPDHFSDPKKAAEFVQQLGAEVTRQAVKEAQTGEAMAGFNQAYDTFVGTPPEGPATRQQAADNADIDRLMDQMNAMAQQKGQKP